MPFQVLCVILQLLGQINVMPSSVTFRFKFLTKDIIMKIISISLTFNTLNAA